MRTFSRNESNPPSKQNLRKTEKRNCSRTEMQCYKSNYIMFYMPARATLQRQVMKNYAAYLYNISMYSWDLTPIWNTQFDVVLVRKRWKWLSEWPDVILVEKLLEHWQLGALLCFMNTKNIGEGKLVCLKAYGASFVMSHRIFFLSSIRLQQN